MQTFTQALIELVLAGLVDRELAAGVAPNRHDFMIALGHAEKSALRATSSGDQAARRQTVPSPRRRARDRLGRRSPATGMRLS